MLVLTRRLNESILIGEDIEITIVQVRGSGEQAVIRVGISAPKQITVLRKEVHDEVVAANQQAARAPLSIPAELMQGLQATPMPAPDAKDSGLPRKSP
ncbi:MAG TPA: carbon storage regulator [Symbiobacteriaceae bacterium]|jgi:carbon storage regulator